MDINRVDQMMDILNSWSMIFWEKRVILVIMLMSL